MTLRRHWLFNKKHTQPTTHTRLPLLTAAAPWGSGFKKCHVASMSRPECRSHRGDLGVTFGPCARHWRHFTVPQLPALFPTTFGPARSSSCFAHGIKLGPRLPSNLYYAESGRKGMSMGNKQAQPRDRHDYVEEAELGWGMHRSSMRSRTP